MPVIQMAFDVSGVRRGTDDAVRAMGRLTASVDRLSREFANVGNAAAASGRTVSNSFSGAASQIRRLAAELAGLYSAFKAVEGAKNFIERGIEVNAKLEQAQLTIASIVGSLNDITDAQGRVLKGAEKFRASEELAKNLLDEMQLLAMQTTASFTDIADGVASIIAPATRAGISLEKLPRFTVTAVQAMAAMGLHTTQMRTEIEALLSGNISRTQDVLATNLGITREMVEQWQKSGTVLEEINKRLEMFSIAGARALTTWRGLQGNMQGALDKLASFGSEELFKHIKTAWADLIEFMLEEGDDGKLHLSKNLDGLMKQLREIEGEIGLKIVDAVRTLMDWIKDLNKPENLRVVLEKWRNFKDACNEVIEKLGEVAQNVKIITDACGGLAGMVQSVERAFASLSKTIASIPSIPDHLHWVPFQNGRGDAILEEAARAGEKEDNARREKAAGLGVYVNRHDVRSRQGKAPRLDDLLPADGGGSASNRAIIDELEAKFESKIEEAGKTAGETAGKTTAELVGLKIERKGLSAGPWLSDQLKGNPLGIGRSVGEQPPPAPAKADAGKDEAGSKVTLTPTVEPYKPKAPKTPKARAPKKSAGERDAERFAENSARYASELERLRNEVNALDAAMKPGLTTYDRMVAKINAEREAAIKNAEVKKEESIRRKECTAAQAEETAALEKRKAELEAQKALDELQTQTLQDRATWYREYAELTGKASLGLDLQNQLIEKQGREWEALGIPIDLVTDRIERMKLAIATDPLSGLKRGFQTLAAQAQNDAQIMEGALTTTCDVMGNAFGSFVSSGKASMTDLLNSWIATINQMVAKAAMSKIFSAIGGWFGFGAPSGGGGGVSAAASAITSAVGMLHAHGDVFAGLDGYSNSIVSRPVFFGYRRQLTAFARGAGVMGEAGPEAVMPLTRMNNGNLGVQAAGGGAGVLSVELYITDATRNGVDAEAESGELDGRQLQVVVRQVEQMMVARALNGRSPYTAYLDKSRGLSNAKSLY